VILDTHVWIFYATERGLDPKGLRSIERARKLGRLQIASVTLWEVALLVQERRLRLTLPTSEWFRDALTLTGVHIAPLDVAIAIQAARLARPLRDPADCQVVGTAIKIGVPLATRDARILENAKPLGLDVIEV
jgi:PIN domain nuclease of toxin-antitoxin system